MFASGGGTELTPAQEFELDNSWKMGPGMSGNGLGQAGVPFDYSNLQKITLADSSIIFIPFWLPPGTAITKFSFLTTIPDCVFAGECAIYECDEGHLKYPSNRIWHAYLSPTPPTKHANTDGWITYHFEQEIPATGNQPRCWWAICTAANDSVPIFIVNYHQGIYSGTGRMIMPMLGYNGPLWPVGPDPEPPLVMPFGTGYLSPFYDAVMCWNFDFLEDDINKR